MDMKDVTSTTFGYIIGFLLPGFVGLYGLGFFSSRIESILQPARNPDATLGPSVMVLLAALASGLFLSAVRCVLFEKAVCRKKHFAPNMFAKLAAGDRLISFKAVVDEHYRYHQFYGGCFLALLIVFSGWLWTVHTHLSVTSLVLSTVGFLIFEVLIYFTSVDAYNKYVDRGNIIVRGEMDSPKEMNVNVKRVGQ